MVKNCVKAIIAGSLIASLSGCIVYSTDRNPECPCYQQIKNCVKAIIAGSLIASLSGCIVYSTDRNPECPCYQQKYINGTRPVNEPFVCPYHRRHFDGCRYCETQQRYQKGR